MDKGKKEEALDPIMMNEYQIKRIMETTGKMCSGVPYQYKVNTKKRVVVMGEGLESDEEEVEGLWAVEQIEEILRATYEIKMRGPTVGIEGNTTIHINVSVETINPCATNTPRRTPTFRKLNFKRRKRSCSSRSLEPCIKKGTQNGRPELSEMVRQHLLLNSFPASNWL
jgi:hypothetical protein